MPSPLSEDGLRLEIASDVLLQIDLVTKGEISLARTSPRILVKL
jgi:hypothetical protein